MPGAQGVESIVHVRDLAGSSRFDRRSSMDIAAVALIALVVFAWGLFSARLSRVDLGAPIIFVTVGLLLAEGLHVIEPDGWQEIVKLLRTRPEITTVFGT